MAPETEQDRHTPDHASEKFSESANYSHDKQARQSQDRQSQDRQEQPEEDIDFKSLFLVFWRRKWLILSLLFIGVIGSLYYSGKIEPVFTTRSYVLLETDRKVPAELSGLIEGFKVEDSIILSETQILKSRNFALKVVQSLSLAQDPEFNPGLRDQQGQWKKKIDKFTEELLRRNSSDTSGAQDAVNEENLETKTPGKIKQERDPLPRELDGDVALLFDPEISMVLNRLLKAVRINSVPGTNVIYIEVSSRSPRKAALIANAYARIYIEQRLEYRFKETRRLTSWLDKRLNSLKRQVRESQREVARYRVENNLIQTYKGELTADQLTQLSSELIRAKADLATKQAKIRQVTDKIDSFEALSSAPDVLKSVVIRELKKQQSQLLQKRSELRTRYGNKHPSIKAINEELEILRKQVYEEARYIIASQKEEVMIAQARVKALEEGFDDLVRTKAEESEAMIRLRELMMESEASRATYDKFLATYKRTNAQEDLQDAEARIISYAAVPVEQSYPNKKLFAALTAIIMLFLGLALALFLEKLYTAFSSVSELEKSTGYPCIGIIPEMRIRDRSKTMTYIRENMTSSVSENVRNLRTTLKLRKHLKDHNSPKVITITSSLPGEGKSTLSTWLASLAAKSGEKVCLIDCDLRAPVLHKHIPADREHSLVEYLTDQAEIEEVIKKDEKSGLYAIFSKSVPSRAMDLLSSRKMEDLIRSLRQEFDLVILDAPSSLIVSDPKILASYSDQLIYAVAWAKTDREQVLMGIKQFRDIGYSDIATVFTRVDLKSFARHGYGEAGYYSSDYKAD